MVTPGFLPSRDTCTSLYIVGEGREQDAEASRAQHILRTRFSGAAVLSDVTASNRGSASAGIHCIVQSSHGILLWFGRADYTVPAQ